MSRKDLPKKLPFVLTKITQREYNKNPCYYYKKGFDFEIDDYYCEDTRIGEYLYHITSVKFMEEIKKHGLKPNKPLALSHNVLNPPSNFAGVYFSITPDDAYQLIPWETMDMKIVPLRVNSNILKTKLYLDPERAPTESKEGEIAFVYLGTVDAEHIEYATSVRFEAANIRVSDWRSILKY